MSENRIKAMLKGLPLPAHIEHGHDVQSGIIQEWLHHGTSVEDVVVAEGWEISLKSALWEDVVYRAPESRLAIIVPIQTFDPEPYEPAKDILVVVQPDNGAFMATLFDANVNASGNTQQDAVANLKDMMLVLFERLQKEPEGRLGKWPRRQLAALKSLIRRKS